MGAERILDRAGHTAKGGLMENNVYLGAATDGLELFVLRAGCWVLEF